MTFKESVKIQLTSAAREYKKLLNKDYIIQSNQFKFSDIYLLRFHEDNFLHLTGIITSLKAQMFFKKCLIGNLNNEEFTCDTSKELKGKVKEKLKNLNTIGEFFDRELVFQEYYKKNRVECKIASSDGKCTLGFVNIHSFIYVPLTLLNKNQINEKKQIKEFTLTIKSKPNDNK